MTILRGLLVCVSICLYVDFVKGHGRLIEPAARNAMWRFNYKNPRNYNDMGLNCGGFTNQFERQGGRCGVCGDPWEGPRDHEAGGKYARGVVARQYQVGAFINVTVQLTSNHGGYFEFRLCPVNDPTKRVTQACLNRHVLNIIGHGTRYFITSKQGSVTLETAVMLPPNLQCSQCVMQWKWVAGQSMGPDGYGGECLGCGNQENFVNCADIAIGSAVVSPLPPLPGDTPAEPQPPAPAPAPAGPAYNTYPTAAPQNVQPDMALVKQIVNQLAEKLRPKLYPTTTPTWRTPAQVPTARVTVSQWNKVQSPQSQQSWQATSAPQQSWRAPPPQQNSWQTTSQESFDWMGAGSHQHVTEAPHFPGYEPGEYPEPGEGPSSGSGSSGQSSYIQGYNDALRQLKGSFGMTANPAFNEISVHLQESHKNTGHMQTCPDGSELECRAVNSMMSSDFDSFCSNACSSGPCPTNMCSCTCPNGGAWSGGGDALGVGGNCFAVDRSKGSSMDQWCVSNCKQNNCPPDLCTCH